MLCHQSKGGGVVSEQKLKRDQCCVRTKGMVLCQTKGANVVSGQWGIVLCQSKGDGVSGGKGLVLYQSERGQCCVRTKGIVLYRDKWV